MAKWDNYITILFIYLFFLTQLFSDEDITCMSNFNGGIYVLETIKSESSSLGSIDAISILILSSFLYSFLIIWRKKKEEEKDTFVAAEKYEEKLIRRD